jgi:hypothetical protein
MNHLLQIEHLFIELALNQHLEQHFLIKVYSSITLPAAGFMKSCIIRLIGL